MRLALAALLPLLFAQDKPTWPQIVEIGQKNLEREKEMRAAIPREAFDPAALAKALDGDPAKAADYVRNHIALEPVRGFVKGAQGALVSQRAGWADRALLLATLVADRSPILVKGALAAAKQPAIAVSAVAVGAAAPADVAARLKSDPKRLEKKVVEADAAAAAFRERTWTRIDRDLKAVAGALQSAGVALPAEIAAPSDEVWWVRIGDKDYGRPEGAEEQAAVAVAELPAEDVHKVTFRMTIQQGEDEQVVLEGTYRTMDLFGRVLTLSTVAGENTKRFLKLQSVKAKDYVDAMAATEVFVPMLSGGGKPVTGHPFDLKGNKVGVKNGAIQKLGGALAVFDALPGGGEKKTELTGARLEVVRHAPGAEPSTSRRDLLAKGVKGRQRVLDLLAVREILVLPGDLRGDFALDLLLQADIAVKEAVLPQIKPAALNVTKRPSRLNARLYEFALARAAARRELSARLKADASTGTALVSFVSRIVDGKTPAVRAGFDILSNPWTNLVAAKGWGESPAFAAGLVDTALEHEVNRAKGPHSNASVQLERGGALKVETPEGRVRVVIPGKPAAWYDVDARTGASLGYTEEGGGQDMAEYATLLADTLEEVREWQSMADRINSALECAMSAIDAADAESSMACCLAKMAIGEAFGWASGGIIGGAAGDNPFARLAGMGLEDALGGAFGDAMGMAPGCH